MSLILLMLVCKNGLVYFSLAYSLFITRQLYEDCLLHRLIIVTMNRQKHIKIRF
uniref:Uncharacterized protein n=1 Tax=Arundo donax TaxID=35708 RepID=A0A0A8YDK9_ARUDO